MATVVLRTSSTGGDYNADCDLALVALTPGLARIILKRIALVRSLHRRDSDIFEIHYFDWSARFLCEGDQLDGLVDARSGRAIYDPLDDGGVGFLAAWPAIPEGSFQRTECNEMLVRDDAVAWTAIPKHTDISVTTTEIPVNMLKWAASRQASRGGRRG